VLVHTSDRLRSLFLQDHSSKPVILLGAGASVKSGIPLSGDIVEIAAKWSYCQVKGLHHEDPSVKRSDWLCWLREHSWYKSQETAADNYPSVIHNLLQPRENRREFFLRLISPSVPASPGYRHLLDLMDQGHIETVLTTNFDRVLPHLHVQRRRPHYLEIIQTPADYTKFTCAPTYPQFVYVHGSVEHYTDKNLPDEVVRLDPNLVSLLTPLLRDHPLIVIGYRGAEPSIMQHLLVDQRQKTNDFRRGIYWCVLPSNVVYPSVAALANALGGNMQLIEIRGFDEVMEVLAQTCSALPKSSRPISSSSSSLDDSEIPFDMKICFDAALEELDWARVQLQIVTYCRRMQIGVPQSISRPWLIERMEQLDLLRRCEAGLLPTMAAYLMFATKPAQRIIGAECHLKIQGREERRIDGNLWSQLDTVQQLLDELNQPFRLKSGVSESVYPYPPLALKELLVNALVHRSYSLRETLKIDIDSKFVRFVNPGGLVESVFQVVNIRLQEQIELGNRGIKGYRNPVIADLFYGAGAMDKEGSGLPDVYSDVMRNEGRVFFGPVDEKNETFRALIYRRQEEADTVTRTAPAASRSKFFANLLEVVGLPEVVWRAQTPCLRAFDIMENAHPVTLPPFQLKPGTELLTFADLSQASSPFRPSIDCMTVEAIRISSFLTNSEGRRNFVELLNRALYRFIQSRGMLVDSFKKRCYFGRTEIGPKEMTYQASFRQATRTVTKPIVSKRTDKTLYWQHESMNFGFEGFQNEWALRILPGYVFTKDGRYTLLHYSRIGALATRKAARDFNMQVYNDIVFWTWVLADGKDSFEISLAEDHPLSIRGLLLSCELASSPTDLDFSVEIVQKEDPRLVQLEQEIAAEAELELEKAEADSDAD
jgi:hypothetical protein